VVLDNDGGGIFEFLPQAGQIAREEFEAILGTPLGLDPERVAALHGIPYERVTDPSQLAASGATALIHVPVDRTANRALHERLGEKAAEALGVWSSR
jgi:2-succinyl-5-enolpyruvyl-6-hydroxy-3-cyclohexene-1-carboxylate synthase